MKHTILEPDYEERFVDTEKFPASTPFLLRGIAAAIQDADDTWRPTVSELAELLRFARNKRELIAAGSAYGAAKQMLTAYPGPKVLLYGAAVDVITQPLVDGDDEDRLQSAIKRIKLAGIEAEEDITWLIQTASDRVRMGRISQKIRTELHEGLRLSGKYESELAKELAKKIVSLTHKVRHRGLIDSFRWATVPWIENALTVDPRAITDEEWTDDLFAESKNQFELNVGQSLCSDLVEPAREACAHLILKNMSELRGCATDT